jgi:hypothetical protein
MNRGGAWGSDDLIIFAPTLFGGLVRISSAGGPSELLASPDASKGERSYRWPEILPVGRAVVFVIAEAKDVGLFTQSKIAVERLDTREKKILPIQGTYPRARAAICCSRARAACSLCRLTPIAWR